MSFDRYFSPGPVALPGPVRTRIAEEMWDPFGIGVGMMEISHRSREYTEFNEETHAVARRVFQVPETHEVFFSVLGAQQHFCVLVSHLSKPSDTVAYTDTGNWANIAVNEAILSKRNVAVVYNGGPEYKTLGNPQNWEIPKNAKYLHLTVNNTVCGTEYEKIPDHFDVPLVLDMTSSLAARKDIPWEKTGLVYASAQKNFGIAGVSVVMMRKDLLEQSKQLTKENMLGNALTYHACHAAKSALNTPPVFSIYVANRTLQWIDRVGGIEEMERRARERAKLIYNVIDEGFYIGRAEKSYRSRHNFVFLLPSEELTNLFIAEAAQQGFREIRGYRNIGGIRASMYNTIPVESARAFADFMRDFRNRH